MDGALGSSLRLITKDMTTYTIAAILDKNNASHGSDEVHEALQKLYKKRYSIDLDKEAAFIASDTLLPPLPMLQVNLELIKRIVRCML